LVVCLQLCMNMLRVGTAFYELRDVLRSLYDEGEANAIAHIAMEEVTGLDKTERLFRKEQVLTTAQLERFETLKEILMTGAPLQYAIGEAHFMRRTYIVSPAVLIPRPETEELVQWIVHDTKPRRALDIGTGSGCIAISLKLALEDCDVTAIDVSQEALDIAKQNADNLDAIVHFLRCDFLNEKARGELSVFDLIVSNPPYIPVTEKETLHTNVRDHEPGAALFVPSDDALLFYRAIAEFGLRHLSPVGSIFCELHRDYAQDTADMFRAKGYRRVQLRQDMQGAPRMLRVQF
jgi:release factor glutamine methyltransferase